MKVWVMTANDEDWHGGEDRVSVAAVFTNENEGNRICKEMNDRRSGINMTRYELVEMKADYFSYDNKVTTGV